MHIVMTADGFATPAADRGAGGIIRIKSFIAHGKGVAAGDVAVLREGSSTGPIKCEARFSSPNGEAGQVYANGGIPMKTPIYYSEQISSGSVRSEIDT